MAKDCRKKAADEKKKVGGVKMEIVGESKRQARESAI